MVISASLINVTFINYFSTPPRILEDYLATAKTSRNENIAVLQFDQMRVNRKTDLRNCT